MVFAMVVAGGFAAIHPGAVKAFYVNIYPEDPAKAEALNLCFTENHAFNRLDSAAREGSYRHILASLGELPKAAAAAAAAANAVDLRQAAGQGSLPQNDIRRQERTASLLHISR